MSRKQRAIGTVTSKKNNDNNNKNNIRNLIPPTDTAIKKGSLKKCIKKCIYAATIAMALAITTNHVNVENAYAQTVVTNGRTAVGYDDGPNWNATADLGINSSAPSNDGKPGNWDPTGNWFGQEYNHVILHLNSTAGTTLDNNTGTVNITKLDTTQTDVPYYIWLHSNIGNPIVGWHWYTQLVDKTYGPLYSTLAYQSAFGGDVDIAATRTVNLTANYDSNLVNISYDPSGNPLPGANIHGIPLDLRFDINNTLTKKGEGTLGIQTNTHIKTFTAGVDSGTLHIDGTTDDNYFVTPKYARIQSTNVNLAGGEGVTGDSNANFHDAESTFNFISGLVGNEWNIGTLDAHGFNSQGVMNVANNTTLNSITVIESATGQLNVTGFLRVNGSTTNNTVLNVLNEGQVTTTGKFYAGTASIPTSETKTYINVEEDSFIKTSSGTELGTWADNTVSAIMSDSTWTNTGTFVVALNSKDTTLSVNSHSELTSTDYISVGEKSGSEGTLNISDSEVSTGQDIYVAKEEGARGTIAATGTDTIITAANNIYVANDDDTIGKFTVENGTVKTTTGSIYVANADKLNGDVIGTFEASNHATVNSALYISVAGGDQSTGYFHAKENSTITAAKKISFASGEESVGKEIIIDSSKVTATDENITVAEGGYSEVETFQIVSNSEVKALAGSITIADGDNSTIKDFDITASLVHAKNDITVASGNTAKVDGFSITSSTIKTDTGKIDIASGDNSEIQNSFDITYSTITANTHINIASGNGSKAEDVTIEDSTITATTGDITIGKGIRSIVNIEMEDTDVTAGTNLTIAEGDSSEIAIVIDNDDAGKKLKVGGYLTIADGHGATGTLDVTKMEITVGQFIRVADGEIDPNNSNQPSIGTFNVKDSTVTAKTYIEFAEAAQSTGNFKVDNSTVTAEDGHFMLADLGQATMDITNGSKVYIKDKIPTLNEPDLGNGKIAGYASFAKGISGYATGTVAGENSLFEVDHDLIVGEAGTGLLFINDKAKTTVGGNHVIADKSSGAYRSFGRDVVSDKGTLEVTADLIVGNHGDAGGYYDYLGVGYKGGTLQDPPDWVVSNNLTLTPKNPDGTPVTNWGTVSNNSPGLAIVKGSTVTVTGDTYTGKEKDGYAYVLLDNKGSSDTNSLTTENFYVGDRGEAYLRIVNGSVVDVKENMYVGNQGQDGTSATNGFVGHGTVRINGSDSGNNPSKLIVGTDLIVGNKAGSQGFLYAHNEGTVTVQGNHIIGNATGSFGRDHFDGLGTTLTVTKDLHVGNAGQAGGEYEYRINGSNPDPTNWFDSANLLLEPGTGTRTSGIDGSKGKYWTSDGTITDYNSNTEIKWSDIADNAPGLALTAGATGTVKDEIFAGTIKDSWSYILIDDKNNANTIDHSSLTAENNMTIADKGNAYTRVLNGGQLNVGDAATDSLVIGKSEFSEGTLRLGNTITTTKESVVNVTGTLITAGNGTNNENRAEGYIYASDGSTTTVTGTHIVAEGQYSFGRDHFNGNGTTLTVTSSNSATDKTVIAQAGQAGGQYRYVLGGGNANDPTVNSLFSSSGVWFDSANLLLEPDQITTGSNVNYPTLTWDSVKNDSPGFALTAGAKATTNDTIVADKATSYAYVLLDNIDNDNPSSNPRRSTWTIDNTDISKANLILGNYGDAYARVINGSLLDVKNNMIVANQNDSQGNNAYTEATIRINGYDKKSDGTIVNYAELRVGNDLTVANEARTEGNLYAYQAAQVQVGNDFTIAAADGSYGRAHFYGETATGFNGTNTTATIGGTLTVGESGQSGLSYIYIPHLNGGNKVNDPTTWFDSVNTIDDDINDVTNIAGTQKQGYTLNSENKASNGRIYVGQLVKQNNAPGLLIATGAKVTSSDGMVAQESTSVGYVVIDNKDTLKERSIWTIKNDTLTIAEHGNAYVRVLNGAMLNTLDDNGDGNGNVIIAADTGSRGTLRVQDKLNQQKSELMVKGDLITAKNGAAGQENVAIGNFYLHSEATANIENDHTIAEGIFSEGRDHIDGNGTTMDVGETLTVGQKGYAGNYVYNKNDSNNEKDPTHDDSEFKQWFDSANTLKDFFDENLTDQQKENMPGLAITAGAVVTSGNGMVAEFATSDTSIIPADSNGTLYRSQGYFVIDNTDAKTGNRSAWYINDAKGDGNLTVASEGTGYGRVISGALLKVDNDMVIADLGNKNDPEGTGNARSRGTVRVYGKGGEENKVSELVVRGNLTTANEGTGSLYIYEEAQGKVTGDHVIADTKGSYGNDHINGHGTTLDVVGTLTVGDFGQAGGRYDYFEQKKNGGIGTDPDEWFDSKNTLLTQNDAGFIKTNSPGLAITAGAEVTSGNGMVGKNRTAADETQGYGYVVIDSKDRSINTDRSQWLVQNGTKNELTVAQNGEAYVRVINGSLLEVGENGETNAKMIIGAGAYGYGTVRVNQVDPKNGIPPELIVHGDLTTGGNGLDNYTTNPTDPDYATGNLYAHDQARIQVDGNHVIADGQHSVGRDHIDGVGTTMNVDKTLTIGKNGAAGGWYQENRYITKDNVLITKDEHYYAKDPTEDKYDERWFDSEQYTLENLGRTLGSLGSPQNARFGETTGNAPGLGITAGAVVTSGDGVVAQGETSNGYVLIDDKRVGSDNKDESVRTRWIVQKDETPITGTDGKLTVGGKGNAFVRVLNGSLLQADSTTIAKSTNSQYQKDDPTSYQAHGSLYVIGGKENPKKDGNNIPLFNALTGEETFWQPSEWISIGATVLGEDNGNERGTLRIEEGAHGVTSGLYIGLAADSQGEVSVSGFNNSFTSPDFKKDSIRSLLEIYADKDSPFDGSIPEGSSTLSVSDHGYLWMHQNSELKLNGIGIISNGAILHLSEDKEKTLGSFNEKDSTATAGNFTGKPIAQEDRTALLDAMTSEIMIINARIEGDGIVTGEDGVFIAHDPEHNTTNSETVVDPGQRYEWLRPDEFFAYYGRLQFGDSLRMSGNVTTNFDVNSGYYKGMGGTTDEKDVHGELITPRGPNYDAIVVQRGDDSDSTADVLAELSGTLNVHARLTDYYGLDEKGKDVGENDLLVVKTIGKHKPGTIISMFDNLKVMPSRFFDDPHQEIRQNKETGDDELWVTLKRKNNPFEEAGNSYNEKQTGKGLDSVYMEQIKTGDKTWLPVLRNLWYIENHEDFLNAYRLFSGEIRAHSLLLPMTNLARYAHNRIDYRDCNNQKHNHLKPCEESEGVPEQYIRCGAAKNQWKERFNKLLDNTRLWGSVIYDDMETDNDGNAGDNRLHRYGIVVGADKPFLRPESHIGVMVALGRAKINAFQASAHDDDLNVGLYHATKLFNNKWEWKNYLSVGVQDYNLKRDLSLNLTDLKWDPEEYGFLQEDLGERGGKLTSDFLGYSFAGNTEFARPIYFGSCGEYLFRPYFGLDLAMVWQNSDSETGNFINSNLVALDYLSATNIRVYGKPGFTIERNGRRTSLHAGLAYAFLMGGRRYTDVNNRFQIGGTDFNIRGVDDGSGYITWNFGGNVYVGKKKHCSLILDYWGAAGSHSVTQSAQLGFQKKF